MAQSLGKRKRKNDDEQHESSSEDEEDMRAPFQRAFEAKFRPLEKTETASPREEAIELDEEDDEDSEASDWDGFSSDDDRVHIVAHEAANGSFPEIDWSQQRAYMSSRPPASDERRVPDNVKQQTANEDGASESSNLKHDLALQRLLKESHLLDPISFSARDSAPAGKGRLKALDLRLQGLGAKGSLSTQDRMPIAHRKGMQAKGVEKEGKRRKDAAENGVILEKARHAAKDTKRRDKSVGGPTVGKFRGGMLKLSQKDLRDIQGPKKTFKGKQGRR